MFPIFLGLLFSQGVLAVSKKQNIIFRERKMKKPMVLKFRVFGWATTLAILFMSQGVSLANPGVTIRVDPDKIQYYEEATLSWSSCDVSSVIVTANSPILILSDSPNGSLRVSPGVTTTYTIVGKDFGGSVVCRHRAKLTVTGAYLTADPGYEINLGSVKPGDTLTFTRTLLIGHSNMSRVTVSLNGTDLTREETNGEGKGIGSNDVLPTTYNWRVSYNRESNNINMNLDITVETKGPGDEGSSDAGVYRGSFTITLSGSS